MKIPRPCLGSDSLDLCSLCSFCFFSLMKRYPKAFAFLGFSAHKAEAAADVDASAQICIDVTDLSLVPRLFGNSRGRRAPYWILQQASCWMK